MYVGSVSGTSGDASVDFDHADVVDFHNVQCVHWLQKGAEGEGGDAKTDV